MYLLHATRQIKNSIKFYGAHETRGYFPIHSLSRFIRFNGLFVQVYTCCSGSLAHFTMIFMKLRFFMRWYFIWCDMGSSEATSFYTCEHAADTAFWLSWTRRSKRYWCQNHYVVLRSIIVHNGVEYDRNSWNAVCHFDSVHAPESFCSQVFPRWDFNRRYFHLIVPPW